MEITTIIHNNFHERNSVNAAAASTISTTREAVYKEEGTTVAIITMNAKFGFDGNSSWVISYTTSSWTEKAWSYESEKISLSGSTIYLSGTLKKWLLFIPINTAPVGLSLGCNSKGTII